MKKRIVSLLLAVAMIAGMLPIVAVAAGHAHPVCGATCSHETAHSTIAEGEWTALTQTALEATLASDGNYVLAAGNYYLTEDLDLSGLETYKTIKVLADTTVTICLNGHIIDGQGDTTKSIRHFNNAGTLNITDCTSTVHKGYIGTDSLWYLLADGAEVPTDATALDLTGGVLYNGASQNGGGIFNGTGATFNLYGGNIAGCYSTISATDKNARGAGIYNNSATSSVSIYGGTVTGNSALSGGGIYLVAGALNIAGGSIQYNKAHGQSSETSNSKAWGIGGGVAMGNGALNMTGGSISNNASNNAQWNYGGGGVHMAAGTAMVLGGTIANNKNLGNNSRGGAIFVGNTSAAAGAARAKLIVGGTATITGNYAKAFAPVYIAYTGDLEMIGGSITGNTSGSNLATDVTVFAQTSTGNVPTMKMTGGTIGHIQVQDTEAGTDRAAAKAAISGGTVNGSLIRSYPDRTVDAEITVTGGTFHTGSAVIDVAAFVPTTHEQNATTGVVTSKAPAAYAVTYDANGGTGAPAAQEKTHGVDLTLSSTVPTRTDYTFKGWATSATGTVAYAAGAKYTTDAVVTLYAVWEANAVTPPATGHEHTSHDGWTELKADTVPEAGVKYYLASDVTLDGQKDISGATICLNGYTLTAAADKRHFYVAADATAVICDCTAKTTDGYIDPTTKLWTKGTTVPTDGVEYDLTGGILTGGNYEYGGVAYVVGTLELYGVNMAGNKAPRTDAGGAGAVYLPTGGSLVMKEGASAVGNVSAKDGGAIVAANNSASLVLEGTAARPVNISYNTASGGGGGFMFQGKSGSVKNVVVEGNTAAARAGGMLLYAAIEVQDTVIKNNTAKDGGGVYTSVSASFKNTEVTKNTATNCGGGMQTAGTVTLGEGVVISENTAASGGGGLYMQASTVAAMSGNATIEGNVSTASSGGGIYLMGKLTMTGGTIDGNYAGKNAWDQGGGGIRVADGGTLEMSGGTISNNVSGATSGTTPGNNSRGGGIFVGSTSTESGAKRAKAVISGTAQIVGNKAGGFSGKGSGVYAAYTGDVEINGGSVTDNSGTGDVYIFSETSTNNVPTLKLTGGTVGGVYIQNTSADTGRAGAKATVTGGKVTKAFSNEYPARTVKATIEVTGGTFHTGSDIIDVSAFVPTTHEQNATTGAVASKTATPATYAVTYDANGGTGAPAAQEKTHGVDLTLSSTVPTRTDYTFKGWATSATGTVAYAAGAKYTTDAVVTLYAVWEANTVTPPATDHAHTSHDGWTELKGDTVPVEGGKYYLASDVTMTNQRDVMVNATICLNGHTLTAATGKRHFYVAPGKTLTVCDCTSETTKGYIDGTSHLWVKGDTVPTGGTAYDLKGGILTGGSYSYGGVAYVEGKLILDGISIAGNQNLTEGTGGAIHNNSAGELVINNTIFAGNVAKISGGAIGSYGKLTMTDSKVEHNFCTTGAWASGGGGGLAISTGTATITDSSISYNECLATGQGRGGGIYLGQNNHTTTALGYLTVNGNTTITGNHGVQGAGIHVSYTGQLTMNSGSVTGNKYVGTGTSEVGDVFHQNQESTKNVGNITINGGTVGNLRLMRADADKKAGTTTVTGGTIKAVTWHNTKPVSPTFTVSGGTFHSGTAVVDVTAYLASGYMQDATTGTVKMAATYTVKYDANGGTGAPADQTKTEGTDLTLSTTVPTRADYDFKGWATTATGAVAYAAGGKYTANAAVTLYAVWQEKINATPATHAGHTGIAENEWYVLPAAGGNLSTGNYVLTADTTVASTLSIAEGQEVTICLNGKVLTSAVTTGYLFNNAGKLHICDCQTTEHKGYIDVSERLWKAGTKTETEDVEYNLTGGVITGSTVTAIYNNGTLTMKGVNVAGNQSATHAAVYVGKEKSATMEDVCIVGNYNTKATGEGGGIQTSTLATLKLTDCHVDWNSTGARGGGILAYTKVEMKGGSVSFNTVLNTGPGGGGVYNTSNGCVVENVTFEGNDAGQGTYGGGYMAGGGADYPSTFKNCTFKNNNISKKDDGTGGIGGGLYSTNSGGITVTGCTFEGNHADVSGGGLYLGGTGTVTVSGNTITGNTSDSYGGAIYVAAGHPTFAENTITNNTGKDCGGLYIKSGASATMTSGKISGNKGSTSTYGSGVEVIGTFNMTGGEISGNVGTPTLATYGGTVTISGGTVHSDIAVGNNGSVTITGGTFKNTDGSAVYDVTKYLASGYVQNSTTGRVTVDESKAVAKVYNGTTLVDTYLDLAQAIRDYAGTGYTVKLFANVNSSATSYFAQPKDYFILDLNGYNVSVSNGSGFSVRNDSAAVTGTTKIFSSAGKSTIETSKFAAYMYDGNLHLENLTITCPNSQAVSFLDPTSTGNVIKNCSIYNANWHPVVFNATGLDNVQVDIIGSDIVAGTNVAAIGGNPGKVKIGEGTRLFSKGGTEAYTDKITLAADSKTLVKASQPLSISVGVYTVEDATMWAVAAEITNADDLEEALADTEGAYISLGTNITLADDVTVHPGAVLDLNTNTLTVDDPKTLYVGGTVDATEGDLKAKVVLTDKDAVVYTPVKTMDVTSGLAAFTVEYDDTLGGYVLVLSAHEGHGNIDKNSWVILSADGGALTSGNYLLVDDTRLGATITIAAGETVNLCLNGNILYAPATGNAINNAGTLNICDCTSTTRYGYVDANHLWKPSASSMGTDAVDLKGGVITGANDTAVKTSGVLNITGGNIAGNKAVTNGGGVYITTDGTLNLSGGAIIGNYAPNTQGGGIHNYRGTLNITGGSVSYNTAARDGGGISNVGNASDKGTFTVTGGVVDHNVACTDPAGNYAVQGGGVYIGTNVTANITGGTFSNNTANANTHNNSGRGGGILAYSDLTISNATVSGNIAGKLGGGIYATAKVTATNVTVSGNTSKANAGGAYLTNASTLTDCVIKDNTANTNGGGLMTYNSDSCVMVLNNCTITGNTSKSTGTDLAEPSGGGGIYIHPKPTVTINGGKIAENVAQKAGAGVLNRGKLTLNNDVEFTANSMVGTVTWTLGGGAIYNAKTGKVTMNSAKMTGHTNGTANRKGTAVMSAGTFDMLGGEISGNTATATTYGTVAVFEGTFTMKGGVIKNNGSTTTTGGAVYIYGDAAGASSTSGGHLVLDGGIIEGNTSKEGTIHCTGVNGDIKILSGEIRDNTTPGYGGGIYSTSNVTISGGKISGNKAKDGGGLYVGSASTTTMSGGEISGNKGANGAGVEVIGTFNMTGGKIVNNGSTTKADGYRGGGIYIYTGGTATITGGEISGNKVSADGNGTGIAAYGTAKLTVNDAADVKDNIAGIASSATAYPTVDILGGKVGGFVEDANGNGVGLKNLLVRGGTSYGDVKMNATNSSDKFVANRGIIGGTFRNADDSDITNVTALLSEYATQDLTTGTVTAYAATIGAEKYVFLAEAVAAAQAGQTIVLHNPVEVNSDVTLPAGVGLNVNGAEVTGTATLTVNGPFTMESGAVTCTLVISDPSKATITGGDLGANDVSSMLDGIYYAQHNGKVFRTSYVGTEQTADAILKVTAASTAGGEAKTHYFNSFYAFDETAESELFKGVLAKLYGYDHDNNPATPVAIKFGITKDLLGPNAISSTSTETSGAWFIPEDQVFADPAAELVFDFEGQYLQINGDTALEDGINGTGGFFATRANKGITFQHGHIYLYASKGRALAYIGVAAGPYKDASGSLYAPKVVFENMEVVTRGKNVAATSTSGALIGLSRMLGTQFIVRDSYLWAENHNAFYTDAPTAAIAAEKQAQQMTIDVDGKSTIGSTGNSAFGGNKCVNFLFGAGATVVSKTQAFPATNAANYCTVTTVAPANALVYIDSYVNGYNTEHKGERFQVLELTDKILYSAKDITLLSDAVVNGDATLGLNTTLDLNGFTLSGTGTLTVAGTVAENGGSITKATQNYVVTGIAKRYRVNVAYVAGGKVVPSTKSAALGAVITLRAEPDVGNILYEIVATNSKGKEVEVLQKSKNSYTVKMPAGGLNVKATFIEDPTGASMVDCYGGEGCACNEFVDLYSSEWYHSAADFVIDGGLMQGMGNGKFQPGATLSRAMLAQILFNLEGGYDQNGKKSFNDVKATDWYYNAVVWAAENGIVNGYTDGSFKPNAAVTREQAAAMLSRFAKMRNAKGKLDETIKLTDFIDNASVSSWAAADMEWAVRAGIITGVTESTLVPSGNATRIQMAAMLMRFSRNVLL